MSKNKNLPPPPDTYCQECLKDFDEEENPRASEDEAPGACVCASCYQKSYDLADAKAEYARLHRHRGYYPRSRGWRP